MPDELTQRQIYDLKRQLEELRKARGKHTELISLYVPPSKQISDVVAYLRNEYSQSQNIKSKTTMKNVLSAIESIMSRLKTFKQPPPNGLAMFVGHKSISSDKTEMVAFVIEPPMPVITFIYRCDSEFFLQPLEDMLTEKEIYGLLLIDRRECTIGMLRGNRTEMLKYMTSQVPGKHGRGGQSQRRFERTTEIAAHEWFEKCGQRASEIFLAEPKLKGILVGGPGPTKHYFVDEQYLHYEIQKKIIDLFDTGYTDEFGLRELVAEAADRMTDLKISQEKKIMKRFMHEVMKSEKSLAAYGENQVRKALEVGAVDVLLLSDELRKYRMTLRCGSCGFTMEKTIAEEALEEFTPPQCTACNTSLPMEITSKVDLIDELSDQATRTSATVTLISRNSEEGESLFSAFGGIGAILRYPIEI
jgi:peptide chain release factor subunit 1